MRRQKKRRSRKAGLPPGSLIHIGEKRAGETRITVIRYNESAVEERVLDSLEDMDSGRPIPNAVTWLNLDGLHAVEMLERVGRKYALHPLTLEDIVNTDQRPKLEDFDAYLYLVLKMLDVGKGSELAQTEQISIVLAKDLVLTFQEREGDIFDSLRDRIRSGKGRIRAAGADYLTYALADTVVDHYFLLLEDLEQKIEELEETLLGDSDDDHLHTIQLLKRELIGLARSVWPLREVLSGLQRAESPLVTAPTRIYLRDVYDHSIQVIDTVESFRDLTSGVLELYLSKASNRLNNIMKVLTIIATLFIPLTFVAGVYGMNFKYMPELEWPWGYPAVLCGMLLVAALMVVYFKKKGWLGK